MIYCPKDTYYDILAARGMIHNPIEEIYSSLKHNDYRVRTFAAQTIQVDYPTLKSFHIAIEMLSSSIFYEREIGVYILGQLGTPDMPYAEKSLPLLYKMLDDTSKQVISTTISSIGHLWSHTNIEKDKNIINKIIKFTKDKSSNIRISSIMALSSLKNIKGIENIIKYIHDNDNDTEVQDWAEIALEILLEHST